MDKLRQDLFKLRQKYRQTYAKLVQSLRQTFPNLDILLRLWWELPYEQTT